MSFISNVQAVPNVVVWLLAEDSGGHTCLEDLDESNICTYFDLDPDPDLTAFTYFSRFAEIDTSDSNTIYFNPDFRYEFGSLSLTRLDSSQNAIPGSTLEINSNSGSFTFQDKVFTWNEGNLEIPSGVESFEIHANFQPIQSQITIAPTLNGQICVTQFQYPSGDPSIDIRCSSDSSSQIEFDWSNYQPIISIQAEYDYDFQSITISIGDNSATANWNNEDLVISGRTFTWDGWELVAPIDSPDFEVSATFVAEPPMLQGQSNVYGEIILGTDIPFQIHLDDIYAESEEEIFNDYGEILNLLMEIRYFGVDPNDPTRLDARLFCRFELEDWNVVDDEMYGDGGVINVWLPKMQDIVELCPDFHADLSSSTAQIGLFDLEEFSAEDSIMSDATQRVALSIPSAPGLFNENAYSEVEYSQEVEFRITNHELLEYVEIEIESTQFERGCWIRNHVRDLDGNFVTGTLNENLDLIVNIPSLAEINNSCRDEFLDGVDALSDEISYTIYVQGLDEFFNSEQYVQLTLSAAESSNIPEAPTPEPSNLPRERRVEITPNLDIDSTQTSEVPQVPLTTSVEKVTQNQVDAKKNELVGWCKKKGIWIYTKSGKLRMCDPEDEIALEMPACTGKKATPTYPWIFRAQRFFSGDLNSKSGVVLHNAIFFYKGLAISGTEKVDDKPCSNGSVFIPMELSKQVYKFAKSKRPLIWVRNA